MQASVQMLFSRITRLAPQEAAPDTEPEAAPMESSTAKHLEQPAVHEAATSAIHEAAAAAIHEPVADAATQELVEAAKAVKAEAHDLVAAKEPAAMPQSKSVRIALERLDRMMNAVGELVINRTRMLGRVAELERLADVLNFSKARMTDQVSQFQEKHEFGRIHALPARRQPASDIFPLRGGYSSYS